MNAAQLKHMVNRFLRWHLPADFSPDAGIRYTRGHPSHPGPSGTNLLDASQAEEMISYITAGLPQASELPQDGCDNRRSHYDRRVRQMSQWVIVYRKSNGRIGYICNGSDEPDGVATWDSRSDAEYYADENPCLQAHAYQILEVHFK